MDITLYWGVICLKKINVEDLGKVKWYERVFAFFMMLLVLHNKEKRNALWALVRYGRITAMLEAYF